MDTIILKPRRSAPFKGRHPWLFSGAIASLQGNPKPGDWVQVFDDRQNFLAYGLYNPHSQIRVRLYVFEESPPTTDLWERRIRQSIDLRDKTLGFAPAADSACRLINSEGDGLSGLTVDCFGNYLSVQFTSLALYRHKDHILSALQKLTSCQGIMLRTEQDMLEEENLELKDGIIYGGVPETPLIISENGVRFEVNLQTGQKTGFYLDQRANRILIEQFAAGKSVLDLCTYSGGFALHAAQANAKQVTAVDVSTSALELAQRNAALNGFDNITFHKFDMFKYLEKCLAEGIKYDLIILDPPKLTRSQGSVQSALKGYLQLNSMAMQCLNQGGMLFTCSCSGRVSRDDFLLTLHRAALSVHKQLQILEVRGADMDHPVSSACPESEYLKCVVCYTQ
jgi:23S rRNA (cytosine1962-C5)-methyltransferase